MRIVTLEEHYTFADLAEQVDHEAIARRGMPLPGSPAAAGCATTAACRSRRRPHRRHGRIRHFRAGAVAVRPRRRPARARPGHPAGEELSTTASPP